uniref:Putative secreted protein n=1 Tax=Anopheles darlingi TaxID=43151 RepID=A0A2M4DSJ4_ANODA
MTTTTTSEWSLFSLFLLVVRARPSIKVASVLFSRATERVLPNIKAPTGRAQDCAFIVITTTRAVVC